MDTLVDPIEMLSSSSLRVAPPVEGRRASLPSIDPEAQVQWFSRVFEEEAVSTIDVDISWEEESDTAPTLVLRKRARQG